MISLIVLSTFLIFTRQAKPEPDETPLEVAEKAAAYVINQALAENGGYRWEHWDWEGNMFYKTVIHEGAAGIGAFLLSLYEKTENPTYLEYAEGAAQWIISKAVPERGGYKWAYQNRHNPSGWWLAQQHRGVSGIGEFLLKMYRVTANSTYLEYAKGAAQWLAAMAYYEYGGCFIPMNPPNKFGTQAAFGINPAAESFTVLFLLRMYQETGNSTYLTYVEGTAEWLISGIYIKAENGGYKWLYNYPYHTSSDWNMPYHDSRIACFFYEAYKETKNETYLEYANGALQWIISVAEHVEGNGCKWDHRIGDNAYGVTHLVDVNWPTDFTTIADALLFGYSVTFNSTYLEYAKRFANWVISQGVEDGNGIKFPATESTNQYSGFVNAKVYRFLLEMYGKTDNSTYLDYAKESFDWIVSNATTVDGGYKWRTIDYYPHFPTWLAGGAAGIGYYLISAPMPPPELSATIDVNPATLNLRSKGKWITAYIELPEGYDVNDVNVSTILLNGTVPAEIHPTDIGDEDSDGILDLMVKFDRSEVISYILANVNLTKLFEERFMNITLTITGCLNDDVPFQGSDTVKIIMPIPRWYLLPQ